MSVASAERLAPLQSEGRSAARSIPPVRPRRGASRRNGWKPVLLGLLIPVVVVVLWWLATSYGWINRALLASPAEVGEAFAIRLADGTLLEYIGASLLRALGGLIASILIGGTLGIIAGLSKIGHHLLDGPMTALKAVPFPALIPLLLIWFGIGEPIRIAVIVLAAAFPIYLNTVGGITSIDPKLRELSVVRGVAGWRFLWQVVVPGALPQFLVGFRLAIIISMLALVFAEDIAADSGLGYLLFRAQQFSQTDVIILVAILYAILGLIISALVTLLERVLLPWRKAFNR